MNLTAERLAAVRSRINQACMENHRETGEVQLLAVSKQHPSGAIRALYDEGQRAFGENRVQEAMRKVPELSALDIEWHFIGPIQSNKARDIATHFAWVQSVDREKVLRKLHEFRPPTLPPLQLCLQVNIDQEPQKAGIAPEAIADLAALADSLDRVTLRGLMCIPTAGAPVARTADSYQRMRELQARLNGAGHRIDTLSMGMSGDLEIAVAGGSTMVRVGTDLFGPRPATINQEPQT